MTENTVATLERAVAIAATAHAGQVDKGGAPYILHPLRVMLRCHHPDARIAAVLHDVVEDTSVSLAELRREGFSDAVLAGIDGVTRRDGEEYLDFVRRGALDPVSREVKRADLQDNMDLSRLPVVTDKDRERLARYTAALAILDAG
jgi:(p)ppGpp synthase/HD superfamily hydrolase